MAPGKKQVVLKKYVCWELLNMYSEYVLLRIEFEEKDNTRFEAIFASFAHSGFKWKE